MDRGQVVLAPFPYSNQLGFKRRPACVVSTEEYNQGPDVVVAMITSSTARLKQLGLGDVPLDDWQLAGLLRPSVVRAGRLLVIERPLLTASLGALTAAELRAVDRGLREVLGLA